MLAIRSIVSFKLVGVVVSVVVGVMFGATAKAAGLASGLGAGHGARCEMLFRDSKATEATKVTSVLRSSVEVDGRTVYYEHLPAKANKPTAILFIGLFTPVSDLMAFQRSFAQNSKGEGLIIFAYSTTVESLLFGSISKPSGYQQNLGVEINDYVRQATGVINAVGVRGPVIAIGYSLGSAPAAAFAAFHRGRVSDLILTAPLVVPGDHSPQLVAAKEAAESAAVWNPFWGKAILDGIREKAAKTMAAKIADDYLKDGQLPEPVTRELFIDALVAQIRSIEEFDLRREDVARWPRTHFLLAEKEDPYRLELQNGVVAQTMKAAEARPEIMGAVVVVEGGMHTLMTDKPVESALMALSVMRHPAPRLNKARR